MDIDNEIIIKNNRKKAKKKLLIILLTITLVMILLISASLIIDKLQKGISEDELNIDYDFYPADFEENIFEDKKYIELTSEEFIRYHDMTTGIINGINDENKASFGKETEFLVDMIGNIINGDHLAYNSKFSSLYYENHSPKPAFTMQKVYDVTISYLSHEQSEDGNYTKFNYILEYKIYQNNGTFRKDIGDGSKKQFITITDREGLLLIDNITTRYKNN